MGVDNFRVELKSPYLPALVCSSRGDLPRPGKDPESGREFLDAVAVAHPALEAVRQVREQRVGLEDINHSLAEFPAVPSRNDPASEAVGNELKAIADSQGREPRLKKLRGKGRAAGPENGIRTSR